MIKGWYERFGNKIRMLKDFGGKNLGFYLIVAILLNLKVNSIRKAFLILRVSQLENEFSKKSFVLFIFKSFST